MQGILIAEGYFNKKFIEENAMPEDALRIGGHSALLCSIDEDGITVIDCNRDPDDLNCQVRKRQIKYTGIYAGQKIYKQAGYFQVKKVVVWL